MAKLNEGISQIKKGSALETMYNRLLTGMEQASHETLPDFTGSDYVDGYVVNEEKSILKYMNMKYNQKELCISISKYYYK